MKNKNYIEVYDPIFGGCFRLFSGAESVNDFLNQKHINKEDRLAFEETIQNLSGLTHNGKSDGISIWIRNTDLTADTISVLAHEVNHATQFHLFDNCNIDYREVETPSYYIQFLMYNFLEKLRKKNADKAV